MSGRLKYDTRTLLPPDGNKVTYRSRRTLRRQTMKLSEIKAQDFALGMIIATVCIAFLAALILPALGYPLDPTAVTAAITLFTGLAGGIGGWLFGSREGQARVAAANLRADYEQSLREMRDLKGTK
jgi:hypothetical protein